MYHQPVMVKESLEGLNINPNGIYVDVTFGGGGHAKAILEILGKQGKLIAFDQDDDATKNIIKDDRFTLIQQNFRYLKNFLRLYEIGQTDGIIADLGVSSHQFDIAERGFSFKEDGPLDMRMNTKAELTASEVINRYSIQQLTQIFREYGEIGNAYQLAHSITKAREGKHITTISELLKAIEKQTPKNQEFKYYAKLLQAVRIEVNSEIPALKEMLIQARESLKPGGRLVVISYHSLEDRLVKNFYRSDNFEGKIEKDFFGNPQLSFKQINRKPIIPKQDEIEINNRARSAKLRIAEKI